MAKEGGSAALSDSTSHNRTRAAPSFHRSTRQSRSRRSSPDCRMALSMGREAVVRVGLVAMAVVVGPFDKCKELCE